MDTNLLSNAVSYRLPWSRFDVRNPWTAMEVVATKFEVDGQTPIAWAVREGGSVLANDLEWEMEPSPSNRDADFCERTRWKSAMEAAAVAAEWAKKNGRVLTAENAATAG